MEDPNKSAQQHVIRAVNDGGNEKLLGAKEALKERLMRAVLDQAIHEMGEPANIARSVMTSYGSDIKAVTATSQILKQLLLSEIERTTSDSLSDANGMATELFARVKDQWDEPEAIRNVLREQILTETARQALASLGSSDDAANELMQSDHVPGSRIMEISTVLHDRIMAEARNRTLHELGDKEAAAGSIFEKLGAEHAVITETSLALEMMIRDEIRKQAEKALSNSNAVAEQVYATLEGASEQVREVARSVADRIVGDVAEKVNTSIADRERLANEADSRISNREQTVDEAVAGLTDIIVNQIAERTTGVLSKADDLTRRVMDRLEQNKAAVAHLTAAAKERVLSDVVNNAISEISEDLGTSISEMPAWTRLPDTPAAGPAVPSSESQSDESPSDDKRSRAAATPDRPDRDAVPERHEAADDSQPGDDPAPVRDESEESGFVVEEVAFDASDDVFNAFREDESNARPEPNAATGATVVYVYGIANGTADQDEWPDAGMDERYPVRAVEYDGLYAVVSDVDASEYSGDAGHENMKNVDWLKERARRHAVILESMNLGETFVPLRFCTVVSSDEDARAMLKREYDHYRTIIDRVNGAEEWSVRIYRNLEMLEQRVHASDRKVEDSLGVISQGVVSFVKEEMRRIDKMGGEAVELITDHCVRRSHAALLECARDGMLKPVIADDSGGDIILSAAYLVDADKSDMIRDEVDRLASEYEEIGFRFELSGPWPPYHFVNAPDTKGQEAVQK